MAGDWFKVHRKIIYSEIFSARDAWLFKLWCFCLSKANWKEAYFSGEKIEPGSFAMTTRHVCDFLQVSHGSLDRGLKKLEAMGQISKKAGRNFTTITICNWALYQSDSEDEWGADGAQVEAPSGARVEARVNTLKKKDKKVKKEKKEESTAAPVLIPENLNQPDFLSALENFRQMRVEIKKPMTPTAEKALLKKLAGWGIEVAIVALEKSTERQWQGVFKPKPEDMPEFATSRVATDEDLANWTPD